MILHAQPMHIPLKIPLYDPSFINLIIPLAIRRKRKGKHGHPYIRSFPGLKKGDVAPFINIEKNIEVMKLITQMTN